MLYEVIDPINGEKVSFQLISSPEEAGVAEMLFEDIGEDFVWDSTLNAPRPKNDKEKFKDKKQDKLDEIGIKSIDDLKPHFTENNGRDEVLNLLVGHVLQLYLSAGLEVAPQLVEVAGVGQKAKGKQAEVENIEQQVASGSKSAEQGVTDLESVVWE